MRVNYTVDLRAPETDPARVEHAVRAAEEDDGFGFWLDLDEVAVRPDVVEVGEIGGLVFLITGIAEEANGHVGEWLSNSVSTSTQKGEGPYEEEW